MLEALQFVFSSFWVWLGTFIFLAAICETVYELTKLLLKHRAKSKESPHA